MQVHINQIPTKRNYVILKKKFHKELFNSFTKFSKSIYRANKLTGISRPTLANYIKNPTSKIRIDFLLRINSLLGFSLEKIEENIIWIGNNNSPGIHNPNIPFNFNSRAGARFLAAICNDGCITNGFKKADKFSYGRLMYSNNEKDLRKSVAKDAQFIFGSKIDKEFRKKIDTFLAFPSIARDVVDTITGFKGKKSENNPPIPSFILQDRRLMLGWIEQTIADEGCVKYYPDTYRREINWRRSFNKNLREYQLIRDEVRMLDILGINYYLDNIGTYKTKEGIEKSRFQIRITKKTNLHKLRGLIKIPCIRKERLFEKIISSF